MRVCLIGMSGIGKSFWAKRLAERGWVRHDCDGAIGARLASLVRSGASDGMPTPAEARSARAGVGSPSRSGATDVISAAPGEEPVHALGRWMGMPWSEGYADREARYLALEEDVTREALDASMASGDHVIDATGSVIYLSEPLRLRITAECRVVYLRTPEARRDAMLGRYLDEPKPVVWAGAFDARGERLEDALPRCYRDLLAIRDHRYAAMAHVTMDGGELEASDPGVDGFLARAGLGDHPSR